MEHNFKNPGKNKNPTAPELFFNLTDFLIILDMVQVFMKMGCNVSKTF